MEDKLQRRHHKDTGCIFLGIYSLHSGFFPNNELKRVLGSFTAISQLNFPTRSLYLAQTMHSCDKWLGPHGMCGPRLWDETIVSEGVLGLYMAPKRREKMPNV